MKNAHFVCKIKKGKMAISSGNVNYISPLTVILFIHCELVGPSLAKLICKNELTLFTAILK